MAGQRTDSSLSDMRRTWMQHRSRRAAISDFLGEPAKKYSSAFDHVDVRKAAIESKRRAQAPLSLAVLARQVQPAQ
jgi:hypothetical protein